MVTAVTGTDTSSVVAMTIVSFVVGGSAVEVTVYAVVTTIVSVIVMATTTVLPAVTVV